MPDCFSAKGAALVRLRHLPSGRIYNVVFSHTQADYPKDNEFFDAERGAQFADIQQAHREDAGAAGRPRSSASGSCFWAT